MNDDLLRRINHKLQVKKLRTIDQFAADILTLATTHGKHPDVLQGHLDRWKAEDYNPDAASGLNVRQLLESQRDALERRVFRCDGTDEELEEIIDDIESVRKHYIDTRIARKLVAWWAEYASLYKRLATKQVTT